jgi:hypothetical protein
MQEMWAGGGILVLSLAGHRLAIFGCVLLEPMGIGRASIRTVLTLAVWSGLFEGF